MRVPEPDGGGGGEKSSLPLSEIVQRFDQLAEDDDEIDEAWQAPAAEADEEYISFSEPAQRALPQGMRDTIARVVRTFVVKNSAYADGGGWDDAFRSARPVRRSRSTPLQYAADLCEKQDFMAAKLIDAHQDAVRFEALGGVGGLLERLCDGTVYRLIMMALLLEGSDDFEEKDPMDVR